MRKKAEFKAKPGERNNEHNLIFTNKFGRQLRLDEPSKEFKRLARLAGLPEKLRASRRRLRGDQ